ncbi:MAG TPA: hypothetical protein VK991_14045 [Halomonas sp.]|nr:hypothetical protein [Halomonas sp.]
MNARCLLLVIGLTLAGCAVAPPPPTPAVLALAAPNERVLPEAAALFMEDGYVIRDSDSRAGKLEAVIARWPGYRVEVKSQPLTGGTRVSMRAWRDSQPLPPALVQPWLDRLAERLMATPQAGPSASGRLAPVDGSDQRQ